MATAEGAATVSAGIILCFGFLVYTVAGAGVLQHARGV